MIRRVLTVATAAVAVVALTQLDAPKGLDQPVPDPVVVGAASDNDNGSTWYCPFGTAAAGDAAAPTNTVVITTEDVETQVRLTMFRTAAPEGGETTVVEDHTIAANTVMPIRIDDKVDGGATVEVTSGRATVSQQIVAPNRSDQSDCLTTAAQNAYFATAQTTTGSSAQLWLVNPFPTAASVDLRITIDGGVRVPGPVSGVIIPPRSAKLLDIGTIPEVAELREQFAIAVEGRAGRFVAGLAQTVSGKGLRTTIGVQRSATNWVIPYSFTGADFSEKLWLYNPNDDTATVLVSVIPQGVASEMLPEPFTLEVASRRYAMIDLTAEGRLPQTELRWIHVETLSNTGVVVNDVVTLNGASGDGAVNTRPSLGGGLASQVGTTVQATEWEIPALDAAANSQSVVAISNPSPDSIALVTITRYARTDSGAPEAITSDPQEIPPLGSLALEFPEFLDVTSGIRVEATNPVVVAARTTNNSAVDLAMWTALPVRGTISALPVTGE